MKKLFITAFIALSCLISAPAHKTIVWDKPATEYGTDYGDGYFRPAIDVTRVELKDSGTTVFVTIQLRSDSSSKFKFAKGTYLLANGERYPVVSAEGIEFDKFTQTKADDRFDMVFHFKPLPRDTKVFDFIECDEKGAFQIKGIRPVEERHKILFPSYWRNEKTGNWDIAFLDNHAIYDSKIWDMQAEINHITGEAEITLTRKGESINVFVGKNKKGKRTISIDGKKAVYSMITDRFLPDYPVKDTRTDFVDTNYKTDTATVVGWIKDMPEHYKGKKTFRFATRDCFLDEEVNYNAAMDSLGRFTIKIPLLNSSEFFCDWSRCFVRTMLEPGKTYFLLYDFKEGRRMFMGDDVRLQNELFKYPIDWQYIMNEKNTDFDKYIASADSLIKVQHAYIDELCNQHPTLSKRFNIYRKGNTVWQQARELGQAQFRTKDRHLPANAHKYAYENFWTKIEKPYTLHRELLGFIKDFIYDTSKDEIYFVNVHAKDYIEEIASNQEELDTLNTWKKRIEEAYEAANSISETGDRQRIEDELNAKLAEEYKKVKAILSTPHAMQIMRDRLIIKNIKTLMQVLDSLGADQDLKKMWVAKLLYQEIDNNHKSLSPRMIDSLKVWIDNPTILESIEKKNNHYIAIENREFDKVILNTGKDVAGITEGKEILERLLEPYKGKIVLIDIWGTWCGPCKKALSHSEELYARLAEYDMQFVYLANNSPTDSWENVIKEYNVTGSNVTHFNLPQEQQSAIESYLRINCFPTYKITDKNGNVLDIKVEVFNLDSLKRLVKTLSAQ